ncbi:MAG: efflux RND transporter periplasmic adaptor subunit [Bdellovibrionales bacterium]
MNETNEVKKDEQPKPHKVVGIIQLIIVVIFIVGAFTISGVLKANKKAPETQEKEDRVLVVDKKTINPTSYRISFQTTGVISARGSVNIVPQVGGKIVMIDDQFFSGGVFEKDTPLFEVEKRDFELEVDRLSASVAQAQTAYNLEKAESEAALSEWRQVNGDKPAPRLVARKPQLSEAWAVLKGAKAQLENAQLDLERATFTFPFDGRVLSSTLEHGQVVSAGQSYGSVYDINALEVQASLTDQELKWLLNAPNPEITISTTYLGQTKTYEGVLKRGASALDDVTRFATISLGFKSPPHNLLPGIFVDALIKGPMIENALVIPTSAVQKGEAVWEINSDNSLALLDREIIYSDEGVIVMRGDGEAINVVTSKISGVTDGMIVETREAGDHE